MDGQLLLRGLYCFLFLSWSPSHVDPRKVESRFSVEACEWSVTAVSIRSTGLGTGLWDWTVGLDSEKVARSSFVVTEMTGHIQLPMYRVCEFLVATQLSFRCEFAHDRAVICDPMLSSEESS